MTAPRRIQRKRTKGWKMPEGAVYVGRPSIFGNPFPVDVYGHERATDLFRRWINRDMSGAEMSRLSRCDPGSEYGLSLVTVRRHILNNLLDIKGKTLACWCCAGRPCHADVLLELANKDEANG